MGQREPGVAVYFQKADPTCLNRYISIVKLYRCQYQALFHLSPIVHVINYLIRDSNPNQRCPEGPRIHQVPVWPRVAVLHWPRWKLCLSTWLSGSSQLPTRCPFYSPTATVWLVAIFGPIFRLVIKSFLAFLGHCWLCLAFLDHSLGYFFENQTNKRTKKGEKFQ